MSQTIQVRILSGNRPAFPCLWSRRTAPAGPSQTSFDHRVGPRSRRSHPRPPPQRARRPSRCWMCPSCGVDIGSRRRRRTSSSVKKSVEDSPSPSQLYSLRILAVVVVLVKCRSYGGVRWPGQRCVKCYRRDRGNRWASIISNVACCSRP